MFAGLDKPVGTFFKSNTATFWDGAEDVFYPLGNRVPPLLLTGMYVGSVIFHDRQLEHNTLVIAKSLVISTIFYTRARPNSPRATRSNRKFYSFHPFKKRNPAFIGHSNRLFVATGLPCYTNIKIGAGVWYSLATLIPFPGYQNRPWASYIILGAAIGTMLQNIESCRE